MEFRDFISYKIKEAIIADKKQGLHRDQELLTDILNMLFWHRDSPNRTISDILLALGPKYAGLKKDTLEDNLEYLSKMPKERPFIKVSRDSQEIAIYSNLLANLDQTSSPPKKKGGRPKNIYSLNDPYINSYYGRDVALRLSVRAYIAPHK